MERLSYTAHLSNGDHAINSKSKLSGVAKHNLRKYRSEEYDKENIVILCGTDKLVQDVKKIYKEQFDEAVQKYNANQTRDDRKIANYYEKVANAVIHYDEASPHMHVVAVPVATGFKKGLEKQVSKRKVCTKEFLENVLQGRLRDFVDDNMVMWLDEYGLNEKQEGRNKDLSVMEYKRRQEQKKYDEFVENKRKIDREIGQKSFENQMAEQKLENTYKKLAEVESEEAWGLKDIIKLEKMIDKGPEEPKGLVSAKSYREKVVQPFLRKVRNLVKDLIAYAKSSVARAHELEKELDKVKKESDAVYIMNKELNQRLRYKENIIVDKQRKIDELEEDSEKLGFFKRFLKKSDYDKVIELGEEERDKLRTRGSRSR